MRDGFDHAHAYDCPVCVKVKVNGTDVTSGSASQPIALNVGANTITTIVTAQDGFAAQTYTITVTRASSGARDLNGDGYTDIVLQNTAGQIAVWYMDGKGAHPHYGVITSESIYGGSLGDWRVVGVADLNGDGNADILLQNGSGQIYVWYLNSKGAITGGTLVFSGALGDWKVVGIADLNSDGKPDLLLQNASGQTFAFYLNGNGTIIGSAWISTGVIGDWKVVGVADLNGDGKADILLQNTAGRIFVWYMNGSGSASSSGWISSGASGLKVVCLADMNGDGNTDLVFQDAAGQISVWYMDGKGTAASSALINGGGIGDWCVR